MGQHKVAGASKGPGYKAEQHNGGSSAIRFYRPQHAPRGATYKAHDGKSYTVQDDGSIKKNPR